MSLTYKYEASYGDTVCYLDNEDFAYWPSYNGKLQGEPRMSGGNFTTIEAENARRSLFNGLLPEIRKGLLNAFNNSTSCI